MNTTSRLRLVRMDTIGQYGTKLAEWGACELCNREKMCYETYGIVSCEECQADLLPSLGLRIY